MLLEAFDTHLNVVLVLPEGLKADPKSQRGVDVSGINVFKNGFLFVCVFDVCTKFLKSQVLRLL